MPPNTFLSALSRHWQLFAVRGAVAILFGIVAIAWPAPALIALVLAWGAYSFVDGVLSLIAAFRARSRGRPSWPLVLAGIAGVLAGVAAYVWIGITALVLLYLIAAWAIVIGIAHVVAAIALRKEIDNEWLLALAGVVSITFGALLLLRPLEGAIALMAVVGIYAIVWGFVMISLAFRLRRHVHRPAPA